MVGVQLKASLSSPDLAGLQSDSDNSEQETGPDRPEDGNDEDQHRSDYRLQRNTSAATIDQIHAGDNDSDTAKHGSVAQPIYAGTSRRATLDCLEFDAMGEYEKRAVSRADILQQARGPSDESAGLALPHTKKRMGKGFRQYLGNSLQTRDIRQVDSAFSGKPALWVRHNAIVFSLEGVRAIILWDKLFLFDPESSTTVVAADIISSRIQAVDQVDEADDNVQPFEFRALEGILIYVCMRLEIDFVALDTIVKPSIDLLPDQLSVETLERLRGAEKALKQFNSRAKVAQRVFQELLDEDEDMANMYLTEIRADPFAARNPLDHDEVEILMESYLQVVDDLTTQGLLMMETIDDYEKLIEIHLDTVQNKLLLVDLFITLITTLLTFGGMVSALFGMNMVLPPAASELPDSRFYFIAVVFVVILLMVGCGLGVMRLLTNKGLYARRSQRRAKTWPSAPEAVKLEKPSQ